MAMLQHIDEALREEWLLAVGHTLNRVPRECQIMIYEQLQLLSGYRAQDVEYLTVDTKTALVTPKVLFPGRARLVVDIEHEVWWEGLLNMEDNALAFLQSFLSIEASNTLFSFISPPILKRFQDFLYASQLLFAWPVEPVFALQIKVLANPAKFRSLKNWTSDHPSRHGEPEGVLPHLKQWYYALKASANSFTLHIHFRFPWRDYAALHRVAGLFKHRCGLYTHQEQVRNRVVTVNVNASNWKAITPRSGRRVVGPRGFKQDLFISMFVATFNNQQLEVQTKLEPEAKCVLDIYGCTGMSGINHMEHIEPFEP